MWMVGISFWQIARHGAELRGGQRRTRRRPRPPLPNFLPHSLADLATLGPRGPVAVLSFLFSHLLDLDIPEHPPSRACLPPRHPCHPHSTPPDLARRPTCIPAYPFAVFSCSGHRWDVLHFGCNHVGHFLFPWPPPAALTHSPGSISRATSISTSQHSLVTFRTVSKVSTPFSTRYPAQGPFNGCLPCPHLPSRVIPQYVGTVRPCPPCEAGLFHGLH